MQSNKFDLYEIPEDAPKTYLCKFRPKRKILYYSIVLWT